MDIKIHWVSSKLIQLSVGGVSSGVLDKDEALELAKDFIDAAAALMSVDNG